MAEVRDTCGLTTPSELTASLQSQGLAFNASGVMAGMVVQGIPKTPNQGLSLQGRYLEEEEEEEEEEEGSIEVLRNPTCNYSFGSRR